MGAAGELFAVGVGSHTLNGVEMGLFYGEGGCEFVLEQLLLVLELLGFH